MPRLIGSMEKFVNDMDRFTTDMTAYSAEMNRAVPENISRFVDELRVITTDINRATPEDRDRFQKRLRARFEAAIRDMPPDMPKKAFEEMTRLYKHISKSINVARLSSYSANINNNAIMNINCGTNNSSIITRSSKVTSKNNTRVITKSSWSPSGYSYYRYSYASSPFIGSNVKTHLLGSAQKALPNYSDFMTEMNRASPSSGSCVSQEDISENPTNSHQERTTNIFSYEDKCCGSALEPVLGMLCWMFCCCGCCCCC